MHHLGILAHLPAHPPGPVEQGSTAADLPLGLLEGVTLAEILAQILHTPHPLAKSFSLPLAGPFQLDDRADAVEDQSRSLSLEGTKAEGRLLGELDDVEVVE